ncbi:hypothetical protein [Actinocrispum wychmicini]|uniref:hypothetical protein n=1 Tax=Actinocrispum wychmicini TaxID=1213861 RepID=UPI0010498F63|nr:hypothetical protein [Actinocrispum wychmicini]
MSVGLGLAVGVFFGVRQGNPIAAVMYGLQATTTSLIAMLGLRPLPVNYPAVRTFRQTDRRAAWKVVRVGGLAEPRLAPVVVTMAETYLKTDLPPAWLARAVTVVATVFGGVSLILGASADDRFYLMAVFSVLLGVVLSITPVTSVTYRANAELAARAARAQLTEGALAR